MNGQSSNNNNGSPGVSGVGRPDWLNGTNEQAVVCVRDTSGSMAGEKASSASQAVDELGRELAQPANKDGFSVAIVDFASTARVVHPLAKATELAGKIKPIAARGGTNMREGLQLASKQLKNGKGKASQASRQLRPTVFIFSDGHHNVGESPDRVAKEIKQYADIVTIAFGNGADEALLKRIATSEQHFYRCKDGRELRIFLAVAGATLRHTLAAGTNATIALSQIQRP